MEGVGEDLAHPHQAGLHVADEKQLHGAEEQSANANAEAPFILLTDDRGNSRLAAGWTAADEKRLGDLRGRPLDEEEEERLGRAVQVFNSVLNNALLNDPGPLRVDQPEFLPTLEALFMTVASIPM